MTRLTVIIKAIQAKNEKIAKYKKFKSAKSYKKPDRFALFISRAKRNIPAENPPTNAASAPLELILFQKIPLLCASQILINTLLWVIFLLKLSKEMGFWDI